MMVLAIRLVLTGLGSNIVLHLSYMPPSVQRSEVKLSYRTAALELPDSCFKTLQQSKCSLLHHTELEQVIFSQSMVSLSFCCPLASRLNKKILHLIHTMKEIINLWMNILGNSKHLFLICSDKTFPPGVNICSRNSQNKTTSHLIICHNYAARCDERISMIYLCHRKRVQLQTWNLLKPMRVSSRWMIKGAKAYQRCSLTLKQCHMDILTQKQRFCPGT